jgi:hypothetical protein
MKPSKSGGFSLKEAVSPAPSDLPHEEVCWQAEFANLCDRKNPLWLIWVTCPSRDLILARNISEKQPASRSLWKKRSRIGISVNKTTAFDRCLGLDLNAH